MERSTRRGARAKSAVVTVLAVGGLLASMSPSSAHVADFAATITIERDGNRLTGEVTSNKPACARGREVVVKLAREGKDQVIDTAKFDGGDWRLRLDGVSGEVYAKVLRKQLNSGYGHDHLCMSKVSDTITI